MAGGPANAEAIKNRLTRAGDSLAAARADLRTVQQLLEKEDPDHRQPVADLLGALSLIQSQVSLKRSAWFGFAVERAAARLRR